MTHKIAIIGAGPAGLAAAVYTARAEIETIVYTGDEPGGQLTKTSEIENYPGSIGQTGPELMGEMQRQAGKFGVKFVWEKIDELSEIIKANEAVIIATGAASKLLHIGEEEYYGKGFSTCAVCDAAFYKGKTVYVVGGGDAAIEDAWALSKFAKKVTMLVRRSKFRASKAMQRRVMDNPDKIEVKWETELKAIRGERVEELVLVSQGREEVVKAEGVFMAIGHTPVTGWLAGSGVELDQKGYVKTGITAGTDWLAGYPTMTSLPGVFAAGDCVDYRYRQAATAAGMGVMAALDAERWMEANDS